MRDFWLEKREDMTIVMRRPFHFCTRANAEECEDYHNSWSLNFTAALKAKLSVAALLRFIKKFIQLRKREYKRSSRDAELLLTVWQIGEDWVWLFLQKPSLQKSRPNEMKLVLSLEPLIKGFLYGPFNTAPNYGFGTKWYKKLKETLVARGEWVEDAPKYIYVARLYKRAFFVFDKKKRVGKPAPAHLIEEPIPDFPTDVDLYGPPKDCKENEAPDFEDGLDEKEAILEDEDKAPVERKRKPRRRRERWRG